MYCMLNEVSRFFVCLALATTSIFGNADVLRFGFTGPFDGPNAYLGEEVSRGIELGLKHVNQQRSLAYDVALVTMNDSYEPLLTADAITKLVENYDVRAMLASIGTPTAIATLPILERYSVPLIAPMSGAKALNNERNKNIVFNIRAGYEDEAFFLVERIVKNLELSADDIAILAQKDSYGESGVNSLMTAFLHFGIENPDQILQIRYPRNYPYAEHAAADILSSKHMPKVIFIAGTYEVSSQLIELLDDMEISPLYAAFSITGVGALAERTKHTDAIILMTQVTPPLTYTHLPLIQEFLSDNATYSPDNNVSELQFEGYIAARLMGVVLNKFHSDAIPTSKSLAASMKRLDSFDLEVGVGLSLNRNKQSLENAIWLRSIHSGNVEDLAPDQLHISEPNSVALANLEGHDYD